jgi:trans-aconitate methyltransferase
VNKWQEIWSRRDVQGAASSTLQQLIDLDGFDSGAGRIEAPTWTEYVDSIIEQLTDGEKGSFFEVGCGSGAFLYPLFSTGCQVGGIDYSDVLIGHARRVMPEMSFSHREAAAIETEPKYDFVLSNGVFHYFRDLEYAREVVEKMCQKAKRAVGVFEVPNLALRSESETARAGALSEGEYKKKYEGLGHLYYSKSWFEELGRELGHSVEIIPQNIPGYGNSPFRFNCIFKK